MQMNPNIILSGQSPNVLGAYGSGIQLAEQQNKMAREEELRNLYRTQGAGIAAGDPNAINALAAYDPAAAFQMRQGQQDAMFRQQQHAMDMRQSQQRMDILSAQERRAAEEYAAGLGAAERQAQAAQIEDAVKMGLGVQDAATWDQMMAQQAPDLVGKFDMRDALARKYMSIADIMKGGSSNQPAEIQVLKWRADAAGLKEGTPEFQEFIKTGGKGEAGRPAGFEALHYQALAAGFPEGSPQYQNFMATRGAGLVAEARVVGGAKGEAQANQPAVKGMTEMIVGNIDSLLNDPYLDNMVGPIASRAPNVTGDAARVQSKMDQISGGVFLQARQMLKGGGQITDFESKRAEAAYSRLVAAQTPDDYRAALTELRDSVKMGLEKLQDTASMPQPNVSGMAPGMVQDGGGSAAMSDDDLLRMYGGE